MRIGFISAKMLQSNTKPVFRGNSPKNIDLANLQVDFLTDNNLIDESANDTFLKNYDSEFDQHLVEEYQKNLEKNEVIMRTNISSPKMKLLGKDLINSDDSLGIYLKQIRKYPLLSPEEEFELAKRMVEKNDKNARQLLINSNLRFVVFIAKKYKGKGLPLIDLIQEGNTGLIRAAEYFRPGECRFCSFAVKLIRRQISQAIMNKGCVIRLPMNKYNNIFKIKNTISYLSQELGKTPSVAEIAERLNMPERDVLSLVRTINSFVSLDAPINSGNGSGNSAKVIDFIPAEMDIISKHENLCEARWNYVEKLFTKLKPKEQQVLNLKYGLHGAFEKQTKEIAEILGLTRSRINQIEQDAIKYLKRHCEIAKKMKII